jgi:G3E family GTPase
MVPITILTGFLGSGKTTLINKIVNENKDTKFALLINEFGEVGVDGKVIKDNLDTTQNAQGEVVEMSNGCLCCVVRSDLTGAVEKLIDNRNIDHIIIETSGLAEPEPIAQTFEMNNLNGKVELQSIICLVDADNFEANMSEYKILKKQIETSDIIVLNKLNDKKKEFNTNLEKLVVSLNPHAPFLTNTETFSTKLLLVNNSKKEIEHTHKHHENHDHHHNHHEHEDFFEFVYKTPNLLDPDKLDMLFLNNLPNSLIRAKGFIRIKGAISEFNFFQMVGARKTLLPYENESQNKNETSFVIFIGKGLQNDQQSILDTLKKCEIINPV